MERETIEKDDERTEQFIYSHFYNDISLNREKRKVSPNKIDYCKKYTIIVSFLFIVVAMMSFYVYFNGFLTTMVETTEHGT